MENTQAYEEAKKKVQAKLGFYHHLIVYAGVNVLLIIINLVTSPGDLWFQWPLLGWGIGLFMHGVGLFRVSAMKSLERRLIEEEMKKQPPAGK